MDPSVIDIEKKYFTIYASNHRSYLDSGILYYALKWNSMHYPYLVAADKMRKVWLGKFGSVAGALFIKRKRIDIVYDAILKTILKHVYKSGSSFMVYLEGQRSRSGLSLPPKSGILRIIGSNIESRPVAIVPVSISFNKIPESEILLKEVYQDRKFSGLKSAREGEDIRVKKLQKKTRLSKLRSIKRRLVSKPYSRCELRFDKPVILGNPRSLSSKTVRSMEGEISIKSYLNHCKFFYN